MNLQAIAHELAKKHPTPFEVTRSRRANDGQRLFVVAFDRARANVDAWRRAEVEAWSAAQLDECLHWLELLIGVEVTPGELAALQENWRVEAERRRPDGRPSERAMESAVRTPGL